MSSVLSWGGVRRVKRSLLLAVLLPSCAFLWSCAAVSGDRAPATAAQCDVAAAGGADVEAVRSLEERGARSNVEGWSIEEARAFFAPTWVSVGPDGAVNGVETVFSAFVDGRSRPWATRFELLELDIRVYCDTAIVIGLAEAQGATPQQVARFRYLNVWRKVDGRWLYSEQQFARLQAP